MDCIDVQRVLSDRHGSSLVDAVELDIALDHCAGCADCAAFARALAALDAIPRPTAPDRAIRRTLEAVRSERVAVDAAMAAAAADEASRTVADEVAVAAPQAAPSETTERAWVRLLTAPRVAIVASAAVVFVAAVFLTVRLMTAPLATDSADGVVLEFESGPQVASPSVGGAPAAEESLEQGDRADTDGSLDVEKPAPPYVVVSGFVYVVGPEATGFEVLSTSIGQATTAKDEVGTPPRTYAVYQDAAGGYYLEGAVPELLAPLDLVVRTYEERTYALVSDRTIEAYGDWPALPIYVPTPTTEDGVPFFTEGGTDSQGIVVYVRTGMDSTDGFAIAPGTPASDPAAGNPNWTWWIPVEP